MKLKTQAIALVPARSEVQDALEILGRSRGKAALKGAGEGIQKALEALSYGVSSCGGESCGVVLLLLLAGGVAIGATIGSVVGAIQATPIDGTQEMQSAIERTALEFSTCIHQDLSGRLLKLAEEVPGTMMDLVILDGPAQQIMAAEYDALRSRGFDVVLEVGVTSIAFERGRGAEAGLALRLEATATLIELADLTTVYRREFGVKTRPQPFSQWTANDGVAMKEALDRSLERLSERMVNVLFTQAQLPMESGTWIFPGTEGYGCCWICPVSPPNDYSFFGRELLFPRVTSLQPTLEWEAFPAEKQRIRFKEETGQEVTDVTYDLRIWEVDEGLPGELVYERKGLRSSQHALEKTLRPGTRYYWSFRACFFLGTGTPCTPWAYSLLPSTHGNCENLVIPPANHYRFQTP